MITEEKQVRDGGGNLRWHYFRKDGNFHGEYKWWWNDGTLDEHFFYKDDKNITDEVELLVHDMLNITAEEKMIIKLTHGIKCL